MARAHEIAIAADAKDFDRGIRDDIIKPLGDAEDALEDLERAAKGADLDQEIEKAQKATKKLDNEIDDAQDSMRKLGRTARDSADDTKSSFGKADDSIDKMRKGVSRAEDGVKEFGEEANSTAKESAASFDGSAESIADAFQEIAANAFAGFGPAGAVAGLALAAGIGIGLQEITKATEAVEELQERASEIHLAALEDGVDVEEYATGLDYITEALQRLNDEGQKKFHWWWEEDQTGLREFVNDLRKIGEEQADVTDIMALGDDAMKDYRDEVKRSSRDLRDQADAIKETEKGMGTLSDADLKRIASLREQAEAGDRVVDTLNREIETRAEAGERSTAWADSGAEDAARRAQAEEDAANAIVAAQQTVQDSVLSAYDSMRGAATDYATTEEGALDISRWLQYTQEHAEQVATYRANLETMQLTPEQWTNLMEMPEATRSQWVSQFVALPEDARAPYSAALNDLGSDGGNQAAVGFEDSFNPDANVKIKVDDRTATADIRALTKPRTVDVKVKTTGKAGVRDDLDSLTRERTARIRLEVDLWNAQRQIDRFIDANNGRTITIYGRYVAPRIGRGYM